MFQYIKTLFGAFRYKRKLTALKKTKNYYTEKREREKREKRETEKQRGDEIEREAMKTQRNKQKKREAILGHEERRDRLSVSLTKIGVHSTF